MTNLEIIKRLKTAKDLYDKDTKPGSDKNGGLPMTRRVTMLGLKHLIN